MGSVNMKDAALPHDWPQAFEYAVEMRISPTVCQFPTVGRRKSFKAEERERERALLRAA